MAGRSRGAGRSGGQSSWRRLDDVCRCGGGTPIEMPSRLRLLLAVVAIELPLGGQPVVAVLCSLHGAHAAVSGGSQSDGEGCEVRGSQRGPPRLEARRPASGLGRRSSFLPPFLL